MIIAINSMAIISIAVAIISVHVIMIAIIIASMIIASMIIVIRTSRTWSRRRPSSSTRRVICRRTLPGWLETRLAQNSLNYNNIA